MNDEHRPDGFAVARQLADNPIAIVGLSGLFPMARNFRDFWQNVVDAADCTSEVPASRWNLDDYYDPDPAAPDKTYCRRGGFVPEVPFSTTEFGLPPNQLEVTTVVQLLSLLVARDVLADAGAVGADWYRPDRTGVVLGVAGPTTLSHPLAARLSTPVLKEVVRSCGLTQADAELIAEKYAAAFAPWEENSFPGLLGNVIAGRVANRLDLGGMNCTVDAACASSLSAVHMAINELVSGRSDLMITGGCDTENSIFGYLCFSKVGALSKSGQIKPLDDTADGTLVGEGIGMLALKRLADAERDGDRVYAVIRGIGSSSDGRFKSIYAPRAEGQEAALRRAYEDADCSPASIGLFEAHATGTRVGDQTELTALGSVLRAETDEVGYAAIGSVKSQIGHTKGAAGAASLMKLALALHHKVLPPTINVTQPNRALAASPFYVNTKTRPWIRDPQRPKRRAAASAMGFGGTNFHAVLEEASSGREGLRTLHRTARVHLWHAPDTAALAELLRSGAAPNGDAGIPEDHARVGFVSRGEQEFETLRSVAVAELADAGEEFAHPKGVFFRRRALADLKIGALFAGQGSQYVDMGLTAVLNNPVVATAFDEANGVFAGSPRPLASVVFPPPVFDPQVRTDQEATLRRTDYAQPAIAALSAGQYRFLAERGLECAGFLGHSFGELTALWAAGSLADEDFFTLAKARGDAMAVAAGESDPGTMAAVQASREDVTQLLAGHPDVSVCNHNAPDQVVVGGGTAAVGEFVAACRTRGLTVRELPVAGAFHTRYVAHAVEPFRAAVAETFVGEPRLPVYANSAGGSYGASVESNRELLTGQLLRTVEFVRGLEAMRADGCTVFVEFGPKGVLTQLVQRTLGDGVLAIPTDQGPTGDGDVALKKAALRLAVLGAPIADVHRADAGPFTEAEATGMVVPLTGRDYVPDSRRELYAGLIGEPTMLEAVAEAAEAAKRVAAAVPVAAPAAPVVPVVPAVAVARADSPVAEVAPGPGLDAVAQQHLALHERYTETQLSVTGDLVSVLREAQRTGAVDDHLRATVSAIKDQSLAIGRSHTRVNEILASLTDLEHGAAGPLSTVEEPADLAPVEFTPAAPEIPEPRALPAFAPPAELPAAVPIEPAAPSGLDAASVESALVAVVAEKTGYPVEMLDVAMDLEADLGVDSIKRVQILGALGERVDGVPVVGPEQVAELRTLKDIVAFIAGATPAPATPAGVDASSVEAALVEVVAEKTGYPVEMLDVAMDLEADLGVDSIKRVQILGALGERVDGVPPVGPEQVAELRTLKDIVAFIAGNAASAAATPAGLNASSVEAALVEVVAEKTGYPVEMLDVSMDLEADLGVDSIKRVQILGVLGERVDGVPPVGPEQVAELRTLKDIVAFIAGSTALVETAPVETALAETAVAAPASEVLDEAEPVLLRIEQVRLPDVDRIEQPYADGKAALVVDHGAATAQVLAAGLELHGWTVRTVRVPAGAGGGMSTWDGQAIERALALDGARLDLCLTVLPPDAQWGESTRQLADTILTAKLVRESLARTAEAGTRAAFVTVTRLDGALGHRGDRPAAAALVGGVGGLVKTFALESPELFCRALDLAPELGDDVLAETLVAELADAALDTPEVAVDADRSRWTVRPRPAERGDGTEVTLTDQDVLVVTGGARGVTARCVRELATRRACEFVLLGRTELTDEPAWAVGVADDALKPAAIEAVREAGEKPTPQQIDSLTREIRAQREIRETLAALGTSAQYVAVDITDAEATRQALAPVRDRATGLVHGAGALADALLPAKTAADIRTVLATKVDGLHHVLTALDGADLKHVVLFGSVAGVLGNPGQADYASANEALNRVAVSWKRERPASQVTAVNWGAWDGGMVTPQLREVFRSRGVPLLGMAAGARMFADQFTPERADDVSMLIGPAVPLAPSARTAATAAFSAHRDLAALASDAVLRDHRVGEFPVFPAAAGLGWAINALERANPGLRVVECTGFEVLKGIVYDGGHEREYRLDVTAGEWTGARLTVGAAIRSTEPGKALPPSHFTGTFVLAAEIPAAPLNPAVALGSGPEDGLEVYAAAHLFHGPLLQGVRRILTREERRLVVECRLADTPLGQGNFAGALHSPALADVVLQAGALLGVWFLDSGCLPLAIGRVEYFAPLPGDCPFVVVVDDLRPQRTGTQVTVTATACAPDGRVLQRYTDLSVIATPEMTAKFAEAVRRRDENR
ncbi:SDR family NAD(P)-dependent oxidoreductase [Amycolatopsis rhabdoformis]|uniref:SDR family NAD(P)-dependent oxidoreductase n=1 Tax=Amycolatopsis rhabdoformis TaxID=1448059 RepID=A0ABZ1IFP6_9PSEU|nr:SDR family NAD(P)-dependent oxidoreductase [Amycolatopsis rhabdoformis]WSE33237.1 SDR family NAD(P)-dependent oxidoreductase [Amycolatopsis rhabdoformis]